MPTKFFSILFLGMALMASCVSTEQVFVDRVLYDTIWVEQPPVTVIETKTDTVWETVHAHDTIIVSQQIIKTDTVFVEKHVHLVDTVYNEVVKTEVVIEVDTVFVERIEIVDSRLRIVHPGLNNYNGVYFWNDLISEWLNRVQAEGLTPKAATVIFRRVGLDFDGVGADVFIGEDGYYYVDTLLSVSVWQVLSNLLLDIPLIEAELDYETGFWWENEAEGLVKPQYDHLMFEYFPSYTYEMATPEKKDWYWEDMFSALPD